jgi:glycosyltransferase involved in cell wall biosynthesis
LVIEALQRMPDVLLLIAGRGPERDKLEALARRLGVAERVRFLGAVPQMELKKVFNAADLMVLASSREGWANVLLESMACGTPVVASNVGGSPEVVAAPEAGLLMSDYSSDGVADAVLRLRERNPDRAAARRYAEQFSWDFTTRGQIELFKKIIVERVH